MLKDTIIFESSPNFSVPCEIVDKYIKAPAEALRLLLFLLRNASSSFTISEISTAIGVPEASLDAAFSYWTEREILFKTNRRYLLARPQIKATDIRPYSSDEVSARVEGDSAVRFLYEKTEKLLARPLSTTDAYSLLSLVDWVGLPAEVVALLLQYCADCGKKTMRSIEKTAVSWADNGICTFEAAESFIQNEKKKAGTVTKISKILGISNRALGEEEKNVILSWRETLNFDDDIIRFAYESMIKSSGSYKYQYMDKILNNWKNSGVKTIEDAQKQSFDFTKSTQNKQTNVKKRYENVSKIDEVQTVDVSWEIMKKAVDIEENESKVNENE